MTIPSKNGRTPSSDAAKRIAALFHRRLTTAWSPDEIKKFRSLLKDGCFSEPDDLSLIERYYASERAKRDNQGIHRRDLSTFLNHFRTELDRANEWGIKHPLFKPRKVIPLPPTPSTEPPIDPDVNTRNLETFRRVLGRLPIWAQDQK